MTGATPSLERRGLLLSVIGALGMSALGIGFHFLTGSEAVLLDGLFSLIGFAVGLLAMRVAAMVLKPDDEHFHFGYAAYEPMLNLAKGLLIAFITLFALISAIDVVRQGGRVIKGEMAVAYAVIAAVGCLTIALVQRRIARKTGSPLVEVDSKNWLVDGAISGAVAVAFLAVVLLEDGPLAHLAPYADPAVVILLSVLTAPIPIQIIRSNWHQLLGRAPAQEIQDEAHRRVERGLDGLEGVTPRLRLLETGRTFYLQLYLLLGPGCGLERVEDLDALRQRLHKAVTEGSPDIGLDVTFTLDPRWVGLSSGDREPATPEGRP